MAFELNKEKAVDVLIWWVEGADGSIDFYETEAVKKVLNDMNYSPSTFYEDTVMHISGLSTEKIEALVEKSIAFGKKNLSKHQKQQAIALLLAVAESNGNVSEGQREKIDRISRAWGTDTPGLFEEE